MDDDEREVEVAIEAIAGQFATYGTRRIAQQIRRPSYRLNVNRKQVRRTVAQRGLLRPVEWKERRATNSEHPPIAAVSTRSKGDTVRPEQVWVSDITCIRLLEGFVYLAIIMDVFTRAPRG